MGGGGVRRSARYGAFVGIVVGLLWAFTMFIDKDMWTPIEMLFLMTVVTVGGHGFFGAVGGGVVGAVVRAVVNKIVKESREGFGKRLEIAAGMVGGVLGIVLLAVIFVAWVGDN